jgi:hypothetical protein
MATDGDPDLAGRLHELERLHASLRAITSTLDLGELVRTVLESIKSVTRPRRSRSSSTTPSATGSSSPRAR